MAEPARKKTVRPKWDLENKRVRVFARHELDAFADHILLSRYSDKERLACAEMIASIAPAYNPRFDRGLFLKRCGFPPDALDSLPQFKPTKKTNHTHAKPKET